MMARPPATPEVLMARDALSGMSEAQRIAIAIEITVEARDPSNSWHLSRLSRLAAEAAVDLDNVARLKAVAS